MSGFDSEAAAYIVGILVGAVAAIAILALLGWYLYRRLGIAKIDDDEELHSLRREASRYEEPHQDDRNDPALRPSTSHVIRPEADEEEEMEEQEALAPGEQKTKLRSAAVAATVASKASSNRKQAWRM
ncbi:membrane-associated protein, putative [Bodo saltans]|uniref:Membrane-associated protein, putative n=1 Tax=Bodo saltans TaxID=75058 RepID=A0A0S4KJ54_BODSA|nr:membrane-associated protein, putative [Bodo saltans]|eukprot:CUI14415.1 membrane-associated protein, putative [Bodo saltans]